MAFDVQKIKLALLKYSSYLINLIIIAIVLYIVWWFINGLFLAANS